MLVLTDRAEDLEHVRQGENAVFLQKEQADGRRKNRERLLAACMQVKKEIAQRGKNKWK